MVIDTGVTTSSTSVVVKSILVCAIFFQQIGVYKGQLVKSLCTEVMIGVLCVCMQGALVS